MDTYKPDDDADQDSHGVVDLLSHETEKHGITKTMEHKKLVELMQRKTTKI